MGACGVLVEGGNAKSSSKVTHCWVGFPPGGGGWRRGARTVGMEEGGARGKEGTGDGLGAKGIRGAGVGLRVDDGSNRDVVLWSWKQGTAAAVGAELGMSG